MFSLSKLSIKIKILILFLLPTLVMLYLMSIKSYKEYVDIHNDKVTTYHVELAIALASFVNESWIFKLAW